MSDTIDAVMAVAPGFTREQIELVKRTVAPGTTDDELALFLATANRTGLDPFTGQLHAVKRWNRREGREVMTIQIGIDGYRAIAARTGLHAGTDDAVFVESGAKWPTSATVTVYRIVGGQRVPFTATARWDEFAQRTKDGTPTEMWARMPHHMLAKCAEALALRKAFPVELGGTYIPEELGADQAPPTPPAPPAPTTLSEENVARFFESCARRGLDPAAVVREATGGRTDDPAQVLTSEAPALSAAYKRLAAEAQAAQQEVVAEVVEAQEQPQAPEPEPEKAAEPEPEPEEKVPSAAATRRMFAAMREVGITERHDRLGFLSAVLGRPVTTTEQLSRDDVSAAIDALERVKAGYDQLERNSAGIVVGVREALF